MYLYTALFVVPHTQEAQAWITVLPANYTMPAWGRLLLPRKRSPDGDTSDSGGVRLIAHNYSSIDPERMKG